MLDLLLAALAASLVTFGVWLSRASYGAYCSPLIAAALYWSCSLLFSISSYNRLLHPSAKVIAIVFVSLLVAVGAGHVGYLKGARARSRHLASQGGARDYHLLLSVVSMLVVWYLLFYARAKLAGLGSYAESATQLRTMILTEGVMYGSTTVRNISELIPAGILFAVTPIALAYAFVHQKYGALIAVAVATAFYQSIELSRMWTWYLLIFGVIALLASGVRMQKLLSWRVILVAVVLSLALGAVVMATSSRSNKSSFESDGQIVANLNQFADYHSIGFALLSLADEDLRSPLNNEIPLGRAFFSAPIFIATSIAQKLGVGEVDTSFTYRNALWVDDFRPLGYRDDGVEIKYNAYCTVLYTFWIELGLAGPVICFAALGWLCGYFSGRYQRWRVTSDLVVSVFIASFLIYGMFVSPFDKLRTFPAILVIVMWCSLSRSANEERALTTLGVRRLEGLERRLN